MASYEQCVRCGAALVDDRTSRVCDACLRAEAMHSEAKANARRVQAVSRLCELCNDRPGKVTCEGCGAQACELCSSGYRSLCDVCAERKPAAGTRYMAAAHRMQSAVAYEIESRGPADAAASPKHLRVGVNAAMTESAGLAELLIAKGVISHEEYHEAMAAAMETEADRQCARVRAKCDLPDSIDFG